MLGRPRLQPPLTGLTHLAPTSATVSRLTHDPNVYIQLVIGLAFIKGVTQLLFYAVRMGQFARYGYPKPTCGWTGGAGFPLTGGTLTASGALCDTDLHISPADKDGTTCSTSWTGASRNHTIGPAWSAHHNAPCPFDDTASDGLGPINQCSNCAAGTSDLESGGRGFGADAGLNTGTTGLAENYLPVYVR